MQEQTNIALKHSDKQQKMDKLSTSSKSVWLLILNIFFGGAGGKFFMGKSFFSWKNETK